MKLTAELTDAAIQRELGARLERRRIDAGLTQARLAEEAGVSKSTVERFEAGRITDFVRLIRVLRVLKLIDRLDQLIPDLPQSPIVLLKHKRRERQRVGRPRRSDNNAAPKRTTPWKWGE
jgi:transcriptional regulator with XRE-family HTH domain